MENNNINRKEAIEALTKHPVISKSIVKRVLTTLSSSKPVFGKWVELKGNFATPGGTPLYVCEKCGGSRHLYGIEFNKRKTICDECGSINSYPWEKTYEEGE